MSEEQNETVDKPVSLLVQVEHSSYTGETIIKDTCPTRAGIALALGGGLSQFATSSEFDILTDPFPDGVWAVRIALDSVDGSCELSSNCLKPQMVLLVIASGLQAFSADVVKLEAENELATRIVQEAKDQAAAHAARHDPTKKIIVPGNSIPGIATPKIILAG